MKNMERKRISFEEANRIINEEVNKMPKKSQMLLKYAVKINNIDELTDEAKDKLIQNYIILLNSTDAK